MIQHYSWSRYNYCKYKNFSSQNDYNFIVYEPLKNFCPSPHQSYHMQLFITHKPVLHTHTHTHTQQFSNFLDFMNVIVSS